MVDKLERQMKLLALLLNTEHALRSSDIRERMPDYPEDPESFRRAFERDKEDLRRIGVPIEIERTAVEGQVDGYRVRQREYYLHGLELEPDEVVALTMARSVVRLEGAGLVDDAVWKLGGVDGGSEGPGPTIGAISIGPTVTAVQQAVASQAVVTFSYRDEERVVEPWTVAFRSGNWYLRGWDRSRDGEREFRLDRVDGAVAVGPDGEVSRSGAMTAARRAPWEFGSEHDPDVTAVVRVDASHAGWARHSLGDDAVVKVHDDGAVDVELQVSNIEGFRTFVLGFLEAAEVLSPPELRADMIDWLTEMAT